MGFHSPSLLSGLLLFMLLALSAASWAHKVNMFAYVEDSQIFLEGYFADGKKAIHSEVTLLDSDGKVLWQGRTDDQGEATIPLPKSQGDLVISLNASMGHKTEYLLSAAEVAGQAEDNGVAMADSGESGAGDSAAAGATAAAVSDKAMRRMIRREVGEAIKPLVRGLSELKERRGVSDIVGGIGIIAGILGGFFFFQARKIQAQTKA